MKKVLAVLLSIFIIIQFIKPARNQTANAQPNDISNLYPTPENVSSILKKACSDCHSNNTVYPWYANVQPVAWWLDNHIEEGKDELNFNSFGAYSIGRQFKKLEEVIELVKEDEMPLSSYTLIHTDAKLTDTEKQLLISWSETIRDSIKAKYPADSLILKRRPQH